MMNEELERKLLRQLRISNIFMGIIALFILVMFAVTAFLVWTVVTFTNDIRNKVENIQTQTENTLDVRQQLCGQSGVSQLLSQGFCAEQQEEETN